MTEVLIALVAPIIVLFILLMVAERIVAAALAVSDFVRGLV